MSETRPARLRALSLAYSKIAALVVAGVGALVLLGWLTKLDSLKSLIPGWASMVPETAYAFALSGLSLWLLAGQPQTNSPARAQVAFASARRSVALFAAALVVILALARLSAHLLGWDPAIERLRLPGFEDGRSQSDLLRMAPVTAFSFLVLGITLATAWSKALSSTVRILPLSAGAAGALGCAHYFFGSTLLSASGEMAMHTASTILILASGIIAARPDVGIASLLTSSSLGGVLARRLLPTVLVVLPILAWFRVQGQRAGWYDTGTGITILAFSNVVVFGTLSWLVTQRLDRIDQERARAEEENARLAAIIASTEAAVLSTTLEGKITSWNRGAEKLFGFSSEEMVGRSMQSFLPAALEAEESAIQSRLERGESVDQYDTVRLSRNGEPVDVSATVSPLLDDLGNRVGLSVIARDISTRKRAERKLQAQMHRLNLLHQITRAMGERIDLQSIYQVVLGNLEDHLQLDFTAFCRSDPADRTLRVSSIGPRSGLAADRLALQENSVVPIDANGLSRCMQGELVYEPNLAAIPFPFPERLAKAGLLSLVVAPLRVESKVFGLLLVTRCASKAFESGECEFLRQLSEHVALAAHQAELHGALQQAYEDLRNTQQAVVQQERLRTLGQMASGIAHDINNALSPVALYTESLLEKEMGLSPQGRQQLVTIQRAVDDVAQTVGRMREFYRKREQQFALNPIDLNDVVKQVLDLTRARWSDMPQEHGIMIEVRTQLSSAPPMIMGVENEIRDALTNLILNAVDAMPQGGTLTVRTCSTDAVPSMIPSARALVHVEVGDSGVGMDEETRRRCIEPFFTTKGDRGTGLGLAMVYGAAQRHNADLAIESIPGKGTTVRLAFPFASCSTEKSGPVEAQPALPPRMRLLIVDDDPIVLRSLRETLTADGHEVVAADGGKPGIDSFRLGMERNSPFDVVITDLGMPYVDGRAVAAAVKAMAPTTPIILVTGWGQRMQAEGDIPPHVSHVLSKPPKIQDLRRVLLACSRHRHATTYAI